MTYDEWVDKAKDQYHRKRYAEALLSAEKAVELDSDGVNGWWFSALSHQALGELDSALHALDIVTDLDPEFANGWARYGSLLKSLNIDDSIEDKYSHHMTTQEAFEQAIEYDSKHSSALTALSNIYAENDDKDESEKEIQILTQLELADGRLTTNQVNRLGILHYRAKNFFDAIKYYSRNIENNLSSASMFNLGLVYNHEEVSQDADAIDIWRLTLAHHPDYERPIERIESLLPRLLVLAEEAQATGKTVLKHDQWYQNYINPLELINHPEDVTSVDDIDIKKVQKLRKRLVSEIELEDGLVEWMDHLSMNRSRAISIVDELNNKEKAEYHLQIFNNKPLLNFLSKGEHKHFLVDQIWSPLETVEYLEARENGFREWLTEIFVKQFSTVLANTIQAENLPVLEALLDGRRWLESSKQDNCFKEARKKIDILLEPLRKLKEGSELETPSVASVRSALEQGSLLKMMNLFPTYFNEQQNELVDLILDIAIAAHNHHGGDVALSKDILKIVDLFSFKSEKSNQRIQKNIKSIEDIIQQEKENEVSLTMEVGTLSVDCSIRQDGVRRGVQFIAVQDIQSVRWGMVHSQTESSLGLKIDSLFVFKSNFQEIKFQWNDLTLDDSLLNLTQSPALRSVFEKMTAQSVVDGRNTKLTTAIIQYIVPEIMEKSIAKIKNGQVKIGPCTLTFSGVSFDVKKFFLFSEECFIPWSQVETSVENGELIVMDGFNPKKRVRMSLRDIDNTFMIIALKDKMS